MRNVHNEHDAHWIYFEKLKILNFLFLKFEQVHVNTFWCV